MGFGGYHPYPRRFGGGKPRLRVLHESINSQRGTALDTTDRTSVVWIENMAFARAINAAWSTNQRLAHQWDPQRMTDMLSRWEKIIRVPILASTTDAARRRTLLTRFRRIGRLANHARLLTELSEAIGEPFVSVEYISLANAVVHVPDGLYPWGTVATGSPWYSTTALILVRLQKPNGYTEGDFYEAAAKVAPILDAITPSWASWSWYRAPESTPVEVIGGPSAGGFYLDDEHNLDNNCFDV